MGNLTLLGSELNITASNYLFLKRKKIRAIHHNVNQRNLPRRQMDLRRNKYKERVSCGHS
ncbi:hypothetical protein [Peribacillus sp. Bi134]|uniref:hypothetical protein n=1 Tax=Peribacillus sp. Bi134 TaxID=2884272 RepID=UPI0034439144